MKALQYLWRTKDLGITHGVTSRGLTMSAYVDSDHTTCPDSRRLVTASATSESEYVVLAEIANKTKFLRQVQEFIMFTLRANNKHSSSRRTHRIAVKHHIVRDAVEEGWFHIVYVRSEEQHADILTKDLDTRTFELHAKAIMNSRKT